MATWCTLFNPLLEIGKYRYKVSYGGRAGMKTEHYALALLKIGEQYKTRILCTREVQNSIEDSVYQTLVDIILKNNLGYRCLKNKIIHPVTGTEFLFKGLLKQTINSIKSLANVDICWVEEAHSVSQRSWDILIPTIRKKSSEIWVSFNPERDDDPAWEMFIEQDRKRMWLLKVNYTENPWFDDTPLKAEMELCRDTNYSKYRNIWLGEPIANYESLVYRFDRDKNLVNYEIKYNEGKETWASWDFGVSDDTFIIFYQVIKWPKSPEFPLGYEIRVFDEYVNNNKDAFHYREVVDGKGYIIDSHACDPSGANRDSDLSSWLDKLKVDKKGRNPWRFEYTHKYSVKEMIDNANDVIHAVRINRQQCPKTVKMFERWQYKTDKDGKLTLPPKPEHDEYSHPGTSFYYFTTNRFRPRKGEGIRVIK